MYVTQEELVKAIEKANEEFEAGRFYVSKFVDEKGKPIECNLAGLIVANGNSGYVFDDRYEGMGLKQVTALLRQIQMFKYKTAGEILATINIVQNLGNPWLVSLGCNYFIDYLKDCGKKDENIEKISFEEQDRETMRKTLMVLCNCFSTLRVTVRTPSDEGAELFSLLFSEGPDEDSPSSDEDE